MVDLGLSLFITFLLRGRECILKELVLKFGDNFNEQRVEKLQELRSKGVIVPLDDGVIISKDAEIGAGTVISAGCVIAEGCVIGENCRLGYGSRLERATLENGVILHQCVKIGAGTVISAGCVIAEGCVIGENCRLGYGSRLERATLENGVILHQCVNISSSTVGGGCVLYANSYLSGTTMGLGYGSRLERATLENGVILHQCVNISSSTVGGGCVLYANSYLSGTTMGANCEIKSCYITDSIIGNAVSIGPFSHIRPNCTIADNVKIGDFVEVKNSRLGEAVHAAHLTYLGDIDCGARVNFGCGVAVANFNGKEKFRTVIEDDVFVGCNTVLVSPVKLGSGAYTASGSVVTDDVPQDAVAIARARPVIKAGMAKKYRRKP